MNIILIILAIFGVCWISLVIMILILGGSIEVKVNNPITKNVDVLTNIKVDRKNIDNK